MSFCICQRHLPLLVSSRLSRPSLILLQSHVHMVESTKIQNFCTLFWRRFWLWILSCWPLIYVKLKNYIIFYYFQSKNKKCCQGIGEKASSLEITSNVRKISQIESELKHFGDNPLWFTYLIFQRSFKRTYLRANWLIRVHHYCNYIKGLDVTF